MTFQLTPKVHLQHDDEGIVRQLSHPLEPYGAIQAELHSATEAAVTVSPRALADQYIQDVLPLFRLEPAMAADLDAPIETSAIRGTESEKLRFVDEKIATNQATVSYSQTALGLPVWQAGVSVRLRGAPSRVVSAQNSVHYDLDVQPPPAGSPYLGDRIDADTLARLLALSPDAGAPTINDIRLIVYAFEPLDRGNGAAEGDAAAEATEAELAPPTIALPPLPDGLVPHRHYVVTEVFFTLAVGGWEPLNWSAFVEPETGAVLQLRVFLACVDGAVLLRDPITASGDTQTTPTSPTTTLDSLRSTVTLDGLDPPGSIQQLRGQYVRMVDVAPPTIAPPTRPAGQSFDFSMPTDDFAAVNAYYHCDSCFRLLADLGFDVPTFFAGTPLPVRVDHRVAFDGNPNAVNASAPGTAFGTGSDGFRFAMLAPGSTIGMAAEARVTWHEFGHAVLYPHLHSPNFRFAHSIGDTLAAIVFDPLSEAPGALRGRTFPWTIIGRRHDHDPVTGFAWGGARDAPEPVGQFGPERAGYQREQILSSSFFRLYRSIGGGHSDPAVRSFAARLTLFLIFDAIRSLSFVTPPQNARALADALIEADLLMVPFEGHPAGTTHKVVRWSFERQGLYQLPGVLQPVTGPGAAPAVDVHVDDGRAGGYAEAPAWPTEPPGLWCRRQADASAGHEPPLFGQDNFIYVEVQNRGRQPADDVVVRVFAARREAERSWPSDWQMLMPGPVQLPQPVAPGGAVVVGPFEWNPEWPGPAALFAEVDCPADPSNASHTVQDPIDAALLAHLDNNLAIREVVVESVGS